MRVRNDHFQLADDGPAPADAQRHGQFQLKHLLGIMAAVSVLFAVLDTRPTIQAADFVVA